MSLAANAGIAILIVFLVAGIGLLLYNGRTVVRNFAIIMFTAKQAEQEQELRRGRTQSQIDSEESV